MGNTQPCHERLVRDMRVVLQRVYMPEQSCGGGRSNTAVLEICERFVKTESQFPIIWDDNETRDWRIYADFAQVSSHAQNAVFSFSAAMRPPIRLLTL